MREIKNLFGDILLFGHSIDKIQLAVMLSLLYDKSFTEDYDCVEINGNTLFTEKCMSYFSADIDKIDLFIDYYKTLLIKSEQYELLTYLKL
jgi:hypothetical protein